MVRFVTAAVSSLALSVLLVSPASAQGIPCQVPANFNPYTDAFPDACRNDGFVPYQVAAGEFKPAAFLFAGGVLNTETVAYLDIINGSTYAQRVDVEIQLTDKTLVRSYVLPPKRPVSIDLGADPQLAGKTLSFSLEITFERLGSATLTMRPAASPWSSAITPTPRIIDLSKATQD